MKKLTIGRIVLLMILFVLSYCKQKDKNDPTPTLKPYQQVDQEFIKYFNEFNPTISIETSYRDTNSSFFRAPIRVTIRQNWPIGSYTHESKVLRTFSINDSIITDTGSEYVTYFDSPGIYKVRLEYKFVSPKDTVIRTTTKSITVYPPYQRLEITKIKYLGSSILEYVPSFTMRLLVNGKDPFDENQLPFYLTKASLPLEIDGKGKIFINPKGLSTLYLMDFNQNVRTSQLELYSQYLIPDRTPKPFPDSIVVKDIFKSDSALVYLKWHE
jgi:hypothetical protein